MRIHTFHEHPYRGVELDAAHIVVELVDHQVTLSGTVHSFVEKRDAER